MPSLAHEHDKATIGRLVNAWSEEAGVGLEAIGSWTIKRKRGKAGAEPDQCYTVNGLHRGGPKPRVPDFAIEVVRGTEEIDKLEIYRRLGVREVWKWQNGTLTFHVRNDGAYVLEDHSHFMPMVDPDLLASLMKMQFQVDAIRALRGAIARKKKR